MIITSQRIIEQVRVVAPRINVLQFKAESDGTLRTIDIYLSAPLSGFGVLYFGVKVNGVSIFATYPGDYINIPIGQDHGDATGLDIAVSKGDIISLDVLGTATANLGAFLTFMAQIDTMKVVSISTASIADGAIDTGVVGLGTSFILKKVVADEFCRIRLYKTAAARTTDSARAFGDLSYVGTQHKMICDILLNVTTGLEWELSPEAMGSNGDDPTVETIYYAITNLSGGTEIIDIDFTVT